MKIRVLVADDHASIRKGLGVAANSRQAIGLVDAVEPDVAVIDNPMPELNDIEAIQRMQPEHPNVSVVVLSIHVTEPYVYRALKAGAKGYIINETAGLEVVEAVRTVSRGERYSSQRIADRWIECSCGLSMDRDVNAAVNVLQVGHTRWDESTDSGLGLSKEAPLLQ